MRFRQLGWCSGWCALALVPALVTPAPAEPVRLAALTPGDVDFGATTFDGALDCLALNVYWEARAEPRLGQFAVAAVTLNRVADPGFPDTVCAVVRQGEERGRNLCQFSWHCDGQDDRPRNPVAWRHSLAVARLALGGQLPDPTNGALWFHSDQVHPDWPELAPIARIGSHIFYRTASLAERATSTAARPRAAQSGGAARDDRPLTAIATDLGMLGCGATGSSCAYGARWGACDGYAAVASEEPGLIMARAFASRDVFRSLTGELRVDFADDPADDLLPCQDAARRDRVRPRAVRTGGVEGDTVDTAALPFRQSRTRGLDMADATLQSLATSAGSVRAEAYLLGAGIWSGERGAELGLEVPLMPRRGAALARPYVPSAKDVAATAAAAADDPPTRLGHGLLREVDAGRRCVTGRRTPAEGAALPPQRVPALANVLMLHAFAGLRPDGPDAGPSIDRSDLLDDLLPATGAEGGSCLAASTRLPIVDPDPRPKPAFATWPLKVALER